MIKKKKMEKTITTIQNLIDYLKIPDFDSKEDPEVVVRKITRTATFVEEFMPLSAFQRKYKEVSIPQNLYIDTNDIAYIRYRFSDEAIYYKPLTYTKNDSILKDIDFSEPIREVIIPEEIYNGGYQFFIDENHKIVASVEVVTVTNNANFIAYTPEAFSYLKQYPRLAYKYENVYGATTKEEPWIDSFKIKAPVHRFPILTKTFATGGYHYRLSYYYKKNSNEVRSVPPAAEDEQFIAISIFFKEITTVLSFLNSTIFNFLNEYNHYRSAWRSRFLTELTYRTLNVMNSNSSKQKVGVIFHLPQPMYYIFNSTQSLWNILADLAKGYIRNNLSINEEDLILKLLRIIYHRSTHKRTAFTINNEERFEEVTRENIAKNTVFIENLITRKVNDKLLLYKLITGLDGAQFRAYISFIWKIWKNSSYAIVDPKKNKKVKITSESPVFADYRSDKILGFYTDNAEINWDGKTPEIPIKVKVKKGKKVETETIDIGDGIKPRLIEVPKESPYDITKYTYHPFAPIILEDSENPKFLLQDANDTDISKTKLPAFVLFANQETAFWQNIITGGEYLIDIITTVSGIGNIIKAGRLVQVLKGGKALLLKTTVQSTKAIATAKAIAGTVEISSGTVNALLKLTGAEDTELGKTVAKYLFYLEMATLAGEISVALRSKLQTTAKELLENPKFEKSVDDLVKKGDLNDVDKLKITTEMRLISKKGVKKRIDIDGAAQKLVRFISVKSDDVSKIIKKAEEDILKLAKGPNGKTIPENQLEYAFIYNESKGFRTLKPFTSNAKTYINIDDAFDVGELTIDRLKSLRGATYTHNHPNFTRFSNADIKTFLQYQLKEIRAINTDGIIYSLKLKNGTNLTRKEVLTSLETLENKRELWIRQFDLNLDSETDRLLLQDFEEEFLLNTFGSKLDYRVFI